MATRKRRTISRSVFNALRKLNPAFKRARSVRVQNLKGGVLKLIPNVGEGFYDATGFHPIRKSWDYDPERAGDEYGTRRKPKAKRRTKSKGRKR